MTNPLKPEHYICPECGYRPNKGGTCPLCEVEYVIDTRSYRERYNEIHADDEEYLQNPDEGEIGDKYGD